MRTRSFPHGTRRSLLGAWTLGLALTGGTAEAAQTQTGTVRVEVVEADVPAAGAFVSTGGESVVTDNSGVAMLVLAPGQVSVVAAKRGYDPAVGRVDVVAGQERHLRLVLMATPTGPQPSNVVASTRSRRSLGDQAVPIEVIDRDEIEQNLPIPPGNIVTVLDGMAGVRFLNTSPELGTSMARIRGLRGHHTRFLADGVPQYFDLPGGLAPVQIPLMDLGRFEVIQAGASAIFGANALGGVVNMLSRRPGTDAHREFLFSQSTLGGTDAALWLSSPATGSWSRTFLASAHYQDENDVDDDGWSDLPGYSRVNARQRVFWDNGQGKSASGTAGVMFEEREGGSAFAHQFLKSKGADGALFGQMPLGKYVLSGAGMLFVQWRDRLFSDSSEHERRQAATIEIELRGTAPRQTWVAGVAADWFTIRSKDPLPLTYLSTRPGIFFHDDIQVAPWLSVSGSARIDHHNIHGFFLSPRGSVRAHRGRWTAGFTADRSYYSPTSHLQETEAAGFARLTVDGELEAETARSVSADLTYGTRAAAVALTVFHSHIDHPALIDRATYTLRSDPDPVVTRGVELRGTARRAPFAVTGTYVYLRARERGDIDVALAPRHDGSVTAAAEAGRGRIGLRVHYTGVQRLDANPYRPTSEPYTVVSMLGELPLGRWSLFVNAENLTDVRQTNWDPIARPAPDVDGRWTVDAWAPLMGRAINAGIKASF